MKNLMLILVLSTFAFACSKEKTLEQKINNTRWVENNNEDSVIEFIDRQLMGYQSDILTSTTNYEFISDNLIQLNQNDTTKVYLEIQLDGNTLITTINPSTSQVIQYWTKIN